MLTNISYADITDQLTFSLSDFDTSTVFAPDSNYYVKVSCDLSNQVLTDQPGDPWLPAAVFVYSLPQGMQIDHVTINSKETTVLAAIHNLVYPVQEPISTCMGCEIPDFVPPGENYNLKSFPPKAQLTTCSLPISFSHAMGVGVIKIRPVIYNIVNHELVLITNISITIHLNAAERQPVIVTERSAVADKIITAFLNGIVENSEDVDDNTPVVNVYSNNYPVDPDSVPIEYMIITTGDFAAELEPLRRWKTSKGYKTKIIILETDVYPNYQGIDNAEKLRNFLIDYKTTYPNDFNFVLLAGNKDVVPIRYTLPYDTDGQPALEYRIISDMYYADIDGNWEVDGDGVWGEPNHDDPDFGAEIYVGRVAISEPGHATTWIEKLFCYELPGLGDPSYLNRVMISSSDQMANSDQPQQIAGFFTDFFNVDTETFREQPSGHDPDPISPSGESIINHLSYPSVGYYFSLSHGDPNYYTCRTSGYNADDYSGVTTWQALIPYLIEGGFIGDISNNGREYLHSSIACGLGMLDCDVVWNYVDECFAEKDLIMEGGSIAGTYNTRNGYVSSSYLLELTRIRKLVDYVVTENRFGPAHYCTKVPNAYDNLYLVYSNNYFGDPEFPVHVDYPNTFIVDFPSSVKLDSVQALTLRVRDSYYGIGVPDVLVTLWKGNEIYERGFTNITGYVSLTAYPTSLGTISIVCSKSHYIPFEDSIFVSYCADAVAGDVNGDGYVQGSDVTYAVSYFIMGGPPPPDSCMCPDDFLYHAADVNGDCIFIGGDVTYLINYLTGGGPAPVFCSDCPVGRLLMSDVKVIPVESTKTKVNVK